MRPSCHKCYSFGIAHLNDGHKVDKRMCQSDLNCVVSRGRYFAERAKFCLGHFWGAPGQNFSSLEENQKIS